MLGGSLEFAHVPDDLVFELVELVRRSGGGHRCLPIAVEIFVRVSFRAMGGQMKDFAPGGVLQEPDFDWGTVMHFEIVHDEEDLAGRILDPPF